MPARTSRRTVTFKHPFGLRGTEVLPAGSYAVETEEELVDVSFPVYRRTATFMFLPRLSQGATHTQMITIDPAELEAALARDTNEPAASSS